MSTRGRAIVTAAALLACTLSACGSESDDDAGQDRGSASTTPSETAEPSLAGTFVADEVVGHDLVPETSLTVTFEDDTMTVNAGCNTMFGGYVLQAGTLTWSRYPASTLMGCEEPLQEQDLWITELLGEGVQVDAGADAGMVLVSDQVTITLSAVDGEGGDRRPQRGDVRRPPQRSHHRVATGGRAPHLVQPRDQRGHLSDHRVARCRREGAPSTCRDRAGP